MASPPAPSSGLVVVALYADGTQKNICKDILTTCWTVVLASSRAHSAGADAAPDTAFRDPPRDAKPTGTRYCKSACTTVHAAARTARSSLVEHTTVPTNLCQPTISAGPRATAPRQLTLAAHAAADDTVDVVPAAAHAPARSPDTSGSPANAASGVPLADMLHCNNESANAAARTAVRIL